MSGDWVGFPFRQRDKGCGDGADFFRSVEDCKSSAGTGHFVQMSQVYRSALYAEVGERRQANEGRTRIL
jgi:hypothetical protein